MEGAQLNPLGYAQNVTGEFECFQRSLHKLLYFGKLAGNINLGLLRYPVEGCKRSWMARKKLRIQDVGTNGSGWLIEVSQRVKF